MEEDLFRLDESEQSKNVIPAFEKKWKEEQRKVEMSQSNKYT